MRHYLAYAARFFALIPGLAVAAGLVAGLDRAAGLMIFVFGVPTALLMLVIGSAVFFVHGLRCARDLRSPLHRAAVVLASPVLALAALLLSFPALSLGRWAGHLALPG